MALKQIQFKVTKGMQLDVDPLVASTDTAYRLYNLKTLVTEDGKETALTNEKGNTKITILNQEGTETEIPGTIIGVILCNTDEVVVFTYIGETSLQILKLTATDDLLKLKLKILASGDFNIKKDSNISGLFVYENSEIQKIYWVDGVNLLRYLNIADSNSYFKDDDFIRDANLLNSNPAFKINHHIEVKKTTGTGIFGAGVIQYAFTYFNKYGAETNLVDMTPLYYINNDNRGLKADETTLCVYEVTIYSPDRSFDYLRLYSIYRSSLNGTPIVKIVKDIKLK